MKKLISFFKICLFTCLIIIIFFNIKSINGSILLSFNLWKENIFPSLFPFFLVANILTNIGFVEFIGNMFSKSMYFLFKIKKECAFIFIMSMLSGFPSSAKYIDDLLSKSLIDKKDAEKALLFSFFSNPLFIVNTIGIMFFDNMRIGILILICHYLGNVVIGVLFRGFNINNYSNHIEEFKSKKIDIIRIFLDAIIDSLKTLALIFGIITVFLIITSIVSAIFHFNFITTSLISSVLEITSGLKLLSQTSLSIDLKIVLSTAVLSFGGLSIHAQIFSILNKYNIRYRYFLLARILHATISSIMVLLLLQMGGLF